MFIDTKQCKISVKFSANISGGQNNKEARNFGLLYL